jgi:hypothetical protein
MKNISFPWRNVANYVILIGVCFGIILLMLVGIGILKDIGNTHEEIANAHDNLMQLS